MSVDSKSRRSFGSSTPSFSSSMIKIFDLSFQSFMRAGRLVQEVAKDAMTLLVLFTERRGLWTRRWTRIVLKLRSLF